MNIKKFDEFINENLADDSEIFLSKIPEIIKKFGEEKKHDLINVINQIKSYSFKTYDINDGVKFVFKLMNVEGNVMVQILNSNGNARSTAQHNIRISWVLTPKESWLNDPVNVKKAGDVEIKLDENTAKELISIFTKNNN